MYDVLLYVPVVSGFQDSRMFHGKIRSFCPELEQTTVEAILPTSNHLDTWSHVAIEEHF